MNQILQISQAEKSFGKNKALDKVDIKLNQGEWLALLGPNGAGKTTLIKAIASRLKLDDGNIALWDIENTHPSFKDIKKKIGLVPQEVALYDELTAKENLQVFGQFLGIIGEKLNTRVDELLHWIGLEDRADDFVKTYSGGMKRRLNIACSVIHQPEIILLDEPTVGVDPQSRQRIWDMLDELREKGASLLLTTHMLDEAETVCDRIVILDHGKVIANGTMDELINQTMGHERKVFFVLADQPPEQLKEQFEINGLEIIGSLNQISSDLQEKLAYLESQDVKVKDVRIEAPTLHNVFIHLTGRELRE